MRQSEMSPSFFAVCDAAALDNRLLSVDWQCQAKEVSKACSCLQHAMVGQQLHRLHRVMEHLGGKAG